MYFTSLVFFLFLVISPIYSGIGLSKLEPLGFVSEGQTSISKFFQSKQDHETSFVEKSNGSAKQGWSY